MLNVMRQGAKSAIAKGLFLLLMTSAVAGMVLMDVGGFFSGNVARSDVAKYSGRSISALEFDSYVRRILQQQGLDPKTAYELGLTKQILDSQINSELVYRAAHDAGLRVNNDFVVQQINAIVAPMTPEGGSRKDTLKRLLMNQGMTEAQFVQAIKSETSTSLLVKSVQEGSAYISAAELRDMYQYDNEERSIKFFILPDSSVKDYQEPSDDVLLPFYQAGQERYAIPETRRITLASLPQGEIKKSVSVTDDDVRAAYDKDIESYRDPEQRVFDHAILPDQETARQVKEKLGTGGSLKDAVKEVTGKTDAYIGENKSGKDGLPREFAAQAFGADKGGVIGPVQTQLGWHVMVIKNILEPATRPFSEVKDEIRRELTQNRASDQLYAVSGDIDDRLAGGMNLEEVAKSIGMKLESFPAMRNDGSTPDKHEGLKGHDADRKKILASAFDLGEGESSPVFELADGSFAVVRVDEINEKGYTPFADVKDDLRKVWIADQQETLNKVKANETLRQIENSETTLEKAAPSGVQSLTLKRAAEVPASLSPEAKDSFFTIGKNDFFTARVKNGYVVGTVTDIRIPDASSLSAAKLKELHTAESNRAGQDSISALVSTLRDKNHVKINDKTLKTMYGAQTVVE